jgi:multicomponent Na+:H+ antiporter subunit E
MIYLPGLVLALAALWFALSGHTEPLFLGFAAFSILASLWLAARFAVIDRDSSPWHRLPQLLAHGAWLGVQVAKANVAVVKAILSPRLSINPGLVKVRTRAASDLGKAIFANSITLTPGTVTVDIEDGDLWVHALDDASAQPASFEPMDKRSAAAGDPPAPKTGAA